jgi:RNA polymerase sigma-70 factor, ECF subfamily
VGDRELVEALRAGDDTAFARVVTEWSRPMLALARGFVSTDATAEEVVQETWLAVITGLDRFEGRSSLRTWVYRILVNTAKTRGVREHRSMPWSSVAGEDAGPSLDPALFRDGAWRAAPGEWPEDVAVEGSVLAGEVRGELERAIARLPERQRTVITLRDVLGMGSEEVGDLLGVSPGNQRVLLHRARTAVRADLAAYLAQDPVPDPVPDPTRPPARPPMQEGA